MTLTFRKSTRLAACLLAPLLPMFLASCGSSSKSKIKGVPANLPSIPIHASASTPPHSMSHADYPFDSNGNYITAWAAEGEKRAGRDPYASTSISDWKSSHHGGSSSSGSSSKKKTASSSKKTASKSKSGSSVSYKVKKGDTLSGIARKYGTTVAKIKAANGLKSDMIRDGKSLKVPK